MGILGALGLLSDGVGTVLLEGKLRQGDGCTVRCLESPGEQRGLVLLRGFSLPSLCLCQSFFLSLEVPCSRAGMLGKSLRPKIASREPAASALVSREAGGHLAASCPRSLKFGVESSPFLVDGALEASWVLQQTQEISTSHQHFPHVQNTGGLAPNFAKLPPNVTHAAGRGHSVSFSLTPAEPANTGLTRGKRSPVSSESAETQQGGQTGG